jgi:diguanylate cyclase (GGDEF)-like protein/PAS domain S-box-containing protein
LVTAPRRRWLVPLTALVGLGLTAATWRIVHLWERGLLNLRFGERVAEQLLKLDREIDDSSDILLALRSFWAGNRTVEAEEFRAFVADHLKSYPEVLALEWLQRVRSLEREVFERRDRPDGRVLYEIVERSPDLKLAHAEPRDEYFPVTFVAPMDEGVEGARSFGFDHAARPDRRAAIDEARRTGRLAAIGPTEFVRFAAPPASTSTPTPTPTPAPAERLPRALVCYLPIFSSSTVPATTAERDQFLLGCVAALIDIDDLFQNAARAMRLESISMRVYVDDGFGAGGRKVLVWKNDEDGRRDDYASIRPLEGVDEHRFSFGSRSFTALSLPTTEFVEAAVFIWPWLALAVGLAVTAAGTMLVQHVVGDRGRAGREMRQFWRMTSEMLCVMDQDGRLRTVNPAWTAMLGISEKQLVGAPLSEIVHPEDHVVTENALRHLVQGVTAVTIEARVRAGDAEWHWIRWNAAPSEDRTAIHAAASDVSGERSTIEELEERASIDALTGVLTRRALFDRLATEFERARRYGSPLSVAVLDLDHFKQVNDRHGHVMGDAMLRRLGQLLKKTLRTSDAAGRFGGDEFVLVFPELDLAAARQTAERIQDLMAKEGAVALPDGKSLRLRASLGLSELTPDVTDVAMLVARADASLYRAKRSGRNRIR